MNAPLTAQPTNGIGKDDHDKHAQPIALKIIAKIISYVFHPIFIPVYVLVFLMRLQPYLFVGMTGLKKTFTIIQFGVMYAFFPVVTTLLLKALGFIDSVYMKTQKDRIIPYVICMIYYFWVWYVIRNQNIYPGELVQFSLAIFITSILGLMSNSYMKVSMHAMAVGVMSAFIVLLAIDGNIDSGIYISAALFITGLVCTARLIVSDHTNKEIYTGLFIGIIAMLLAKFSSNFFNG
jgi:hypothetical protein